MRTLLIAVIALLSAPVAADACTCAFTVGPRQDVMRADAALFGEVISITQTPTTAPYGFSEVSYRLRVLRDYKDNLDQEVTVKGGAGGGASCSLQLRQGQRVGLLLSDTGETWSAGSCSLRTQEYLDAGLAEQSGVFVAGPFGVASLSDDGRALDQSSSFDSGTAALAACPGGRVFLQLTFRDGWRIERREAESFELGARSRAPGDPEQLACLSADGARAALLTVSGRLLAIDGQARTVVARGLKAAALSGDRAYGRRRIVDVRSGKARRYGPLPRGSEPLAVSPNGRLLAVGGRELSVVDVRTGEVRARRGNRARSASWLSNRRLFAVSGSRQRFLDNTLRRLRVTAGLQGPRTVRDRELLVVRDNSLLRFDARGRSLGRPVGLFTAAVVSLCAL